MKKISIMTIAAMMAIAAMAMTGCGNTYSVKNVPLNNVHDSMNYALGFIQGYQVKMYQLQNDSSEKAVTEFIDAMKKAYEGEKEELTEIQSMGRNIGQAIKASEKKGLAENPAWTVNEKILFQGLVNGIYKDTTVMMVDEAREYFQQAFQQSRMEETDAVAGKPITTKCMYKTQTIKLMCKIDSLNYAFGLLNGDQIGMLLMTNDSTGANAKQLIDNINEGLKSGVEYPMLVNIGEQVGAAIREQESQGLLGESTLETNFELIVQGFVNGLKGDETMMKPADADEYIQSTLNNIRYGEQKQKNEQFLKDNAEKEGVVVTESGLQYEVIKMGNGAMPKDTDRVKVHYHGTLIDGTVFDSSVERGEPTVFGLNQVITGWTEGLQLMPVGSKFRFYIPQELGYGSSNRIGAIPPYSTLIFEVELLEIEK